MRSALVTGITGQDGAYFPKFLLAEGYTVYGLKRRSSTDTLWRRTSLGIADDVVLPEGDLAGTASLLAEATFPRVILPTASVAARIFDLARSGIVLAALMVAYHTLVGSHTWLVFSLVLLNLCRPQEVVRCGAAPLVVEDYRASRGGEASDEI